MPFLQLEISTHCNFGCFYCAGRDMAQKHMSLELFREILARFPNQRLTVSLQGEGEPLLHPDVWEMIAGIKRAGHTPYTITNGSAMPEPARIAAEFPEIGISIDTLDVAFAEKIGRWHLDKVLRNLDRLLEHMHPSRVIIHSVDMGQPLQAVRNLVVERRMRHIVQPLQRKEDYRARYATALPAATHKRTRICRQLQHATMRYFNVDGVELPCAFIKNVSAYEGIRSLVETFDRGQVPATCSGCSQLR